MGLCLSFSTDKKEVKVGEYNAVADTLEIINDTIRFQGKARGLPRARHVLSVFGFVRSREPPRHNYSLTEHRSPPTL